MSNKMTDIQKFKLFLSSVKIGNKYSVGITVLLATYVAIMLTLIWLGWSYFFVPIPQLPMLNGMANFSSPLFPAAFKLLLYHVFSFLGFTFIIVKIITWASIRGVDFVERLFPKDYEIINTKLGEIK